MSYSEVEHQKIIDDEKAKIKIREQAELEARTVLVKRRKIKGLFSGLSRSLNWLFGAWVGIALCFSGIGAIVGVPLLLVSIIKLFLAPIEGYFLYGHITCPVCQTKLTVHNANENKCSNCGKQMIIKYP